MTTAESLARAFAEFKPRHVPDDQLIAVNATVDAWIATLARIREYFAEAIERTVAERFAFAELFDDENIEGLIPIDLPTRVVELGNAERQMGSTIYAAYGLVTPDDDVWQKLAGPEAKALKEHFDWWNLAMLQNVSEGQRAALNNVLKQGLTNGWDRDMLTSAMHKVNVDRLPDWRLRTIAQTESIRAWNQQHVSAIVSAGGFVGLRWLDGQRGACPSCKALDNTVMVFGVDQSFIDPIRGLRAIHPPLHPNCRCAIAGAVESDLSPRQRENLAKKQEIEEEKPRKKPLTPRELVKQQLSESLPNADIELGSMKNLDSVRIVADAFAELAKKFPGATKALKDVRFMKDTVRDWMSHRKGSVYAYVETGRPHMVFNASLWDDLETLIAKKKRDAFIGWTAGANGPASTVIHEFGHVLDVHRMTPAVKAAFDLDEEARNEIFGAMFKMEEARIAMQKTKKYVSRYAETNTFEHFAEDFTAGFEGRESHKAWFESLLAYNQILDKHLPH